jgi:hypothetical protein
LSEELLPLLAALSSRFGTIARVRYHAGDWSSVPVCATHPGGEAVLAASLDSPNVVSVSGPGFGELSLLVVPAYTEATHAHEVVMAAASANDTSTPAELLGMPADHTSDNRAALIALQRWESEGGASA